jgi:16S rRNA (guanine527-N7)-methyltransferase
LTYSIALDKALFPDDAGRQTVVMPDVFGFCCVPALRFPVRRRWLACVAKTTCLDGDKGIVLLETVAARAGVNATQLNQLRRLGDTILEANHHLNLTAVRTVEGMIVRHLVDGLGLLPALEDMQPVNIVDIGSGAGLPGLVLAVCRPGWNITLVEAARKKTRFHQQAIADLGLCNVQAVWGRAEDLGHDSSHRERYDCVCARAVAEMRVLAELALPLIKVGGALVAQKSIERNGPHMELRAADNAIDVLGGQWAAVEYAWTEKAIQQFLPEAADALDGDRRRAIVTVRKVVSTSPIYPRTSGTPRKHPL